MEKKGLMVGSTNRRKERERQTPSGYTPGLSTSSTNHFDLTINRVLLRPTGRRKKDVQRIWTSDRAAIYGKLSGAERNWCESVCYRLLLSLRIQPIEMKLPWLRQLVKRDDLCRVWVVKISHEVNNISLAGSACGCNAWSELAQIDLKYSTAGGSCRWDECQGHASVYQPHHRRESYF